MTNWDPEEDTLLTRGDSKAQGPHSFVRATQLSRVNLRRTIPKPRAARRAESADTRRNTSEPSEDFGMWDCSPSSPQLCCRGESSQDMPICTWQEGREGLISFQVV